MLGQETYKPVIVVIPLLAAPDIALIPADMIIDSEGQPNVDGLESAGSARDSK